MSAGYPQIGAHNYKLELPETTTRFRDGVNLRGIDGVNLRGGRG